MERRDREGKKMKIFNLYETKEIKTEDAGLKNVINLDERLLLKSRGRLKDRKEKLNVVERLMNLMQVPGHRGRKHRLIKSQMSGKYSKATKIILEAFKIIEEKKKENPIKVLVKAIENSAPRDEITVIEYGGARYPQAVDVAPLRRISLALRNIVHGASDKAFNKKASIAEALAQEIILASERNNESFACQKRNEAEKQADSAR